MDHYFYVPTRTIKDYCKKYKAKVNKSRRIMIKNLLQKLSENYNMGFTWCLGIHDVIFEGETISIGKSEDKVYDKTICYLICKEKI